MTSRRRSNCVLTRTVIGPRVKLADPSDYRTLSEERMEREPIDVSSAVGDTDRLSALEAEHRELEARLAALDRHVYLTPDEQLERKRIQKLKLQKKDEILRISSGSFPAVK